MPATTGETTLDLSVVPTERYPLTRVISHSDTVLCAQAFDVETDMPVFIKVKDASVAGNGLRLAREADILAGLSHGQIPRLVDADIDEGQAFPYIVTELKPGSLYPQRLLDKQTVPRLAARICLSALEPLGYVHDQGITHRDVKPNNLLMRANGGLTSLVDFELGLWDYQPSFLDMVRGLFGASSESSEGKDRITEVGRVVGTADYMSPERAVGKRGTAQSDIYSMGVVLYRLLYGKTPFSGKATEVAKLHLTEPIDFTATERGIPEVLVGVMETATQKEPRHRYASAGEMGEALERFLRDTPPEV